MDYTEIINKAAEAYCNSKWNRFKPDYYSIRKKTGTLTLEMSNREVDFKAGAEYYKQITEIEKLTALITNNKGVLQFDMPEASKEGIRSVIEAQTTLRDKLINELKLK
mgnify:CR=1 FL=1